jgi:excinuclease ABC subunit C
LARGVTEACVQVFQVRAGKLTGRESFFLKDTEGYERAQVSAFLKEYYSRAAVVPPCIILAEEAEEQELLSRYLAAEPDTKYRFMYRSAVPKSVGLMAAENAVLALREAEELWAQSSPDRRSSGGTKLALDLPRLPQRIEGFDISNIQGQEAVASMVVFVDGKPLKSEYRRFRIRTVFQANDFAMMKEAVKRRYSGTLRDKLPLPDLILIDGGKGQLSAARSVLAGLALL